MHSIAIDFQYMNANDPFSSLFILIHVYPFAFWMLPCPVYILPSRRNNPIGGNYES